MTVCPEFWGPLSLPQDRAGLWRGAPPLALGAFEEVRTMVQEAGPTGSPAPLWGSRNSSFSEGHMAEIKDDSFFNLLPRRVAGRALRTQG